MLLVIAGEGPARRILESLSRTPRSAGEVALPRLPASATEPLEDCYCAGDAFVFASRTETQGLVLLESMALGVPVVSTAVMGTREVLGRGPRLPDRGGRRGHFAAQVIRLLGDPELRRRLSEEAREYAREWSAPALAARMLDFYREVTAQHRPGPRT